MTYSKCRVDIRLLSMPPGLANPKSEARASVFPLSGDLLCTEILPQARKEALLDNFPRLVAAGDMALAANEYEQSWTLYEAAITVLYSRWLRNHSGRWPKRRLHKLLELAQKLNDHRCLGRR